MSQVKESGAPGNGYRSTKRFVSVSIPRNLQKLRTSTASRDVKNRRILCTVLYGLKYTGVWMGLFQDQQYSVLLRCALDEFRVTVQQCN